MSIVHHLLKGTSWKLSQLLILICLFCHCFVRLWRACYNKRIVSTWHAVKKTNVMNLSSWQEARTRCSVLRIRRQTVTTDSCFVNSPNSQTVTDQLVQEFWKLVPLTRQWQWQTVTDSDRQWQASCVRIFESLLPLTHSAVTPHIVKGRVAFHPIAKSCHWRIRLHGQRQELGRNIFIVQSIQPVVTPGCK